MSQYMNGLAGVMRTHYERQGITSTASLQSMDGVDVLNEV